MIQAKCYSIIISSTTIIYAIINNNNKYKQSIAETIQVHRSEDIYNENIHTTSVEADEKKHATLTFVTLDEC
jgi:hypothetical protein